MKTHKFFNFWLAGLICLGWFAPWHSVGAEPVAARKATLSQTPVLSGGLIYTAASLLPCKAQVASTGQIYSVLQTAIQAANEGDTVKVSGYCNDLFPVAHLATPNGANASWVAYIDKSLVLSGGYESSFTALPDPLKYPTTIDGRQQGGGILVKGASTAATISGFSIINGLYSGIEVIETTTTIRHNWILGNATGITFTGDLPGSAISIEANYILYNTSAHAPGISLSSTQPHPTITNNVICENDYYIPEGEYNGGWGASGISGIAWSGNIRHNTVCNNRINTQHGAGIQISGTAALNNNIVWGNTGGEAQINPEGALTVNHSDVQGGWFNGTGNLDCNPQFRNPMGDDFHLLPGSCAIDTGATLNIDQDIDADPRSPTNPDMGADEINPAQPLNGAIFGQAAHNDRGVGGITVHLYAKSAPDVWFLLDTTQTDPLGQYRFAGLADGDYRVGFSDPSGQFEPVFSGQQSGLDTAHNVSIVNPAYAIVNVTMGNSGAITGQVTLPGGGDPRPVMITLYERTRPIQSTSPKANGAYTFAGLFASNAYHLYFVYPPTLNTAGIVPEYYNNATTMAASQAVTVTEGNITSGIDVQLDPAAPLVALMTGNGSQYVDPITGQVTLGVANGNVSGVLVSTRVACAQWSPVDVILWVGSNQYPMTETPPPGSGIYEVNLPASAIVSGQLVVRWRCGEEAFEKIIGKFIRYDPSGFIRDAHTGQPVANAIVTLYRVPNGLPDVTLPDNTVQRRTCRTTQTRAGGVSGNWKNEAPAQAGMGIFVNPEMLNDAGLSDIAPAINAQKTDANGHYGWDVVEGCWYVTVQARGYRTVYSPVVGVPPAVMDLDLDIAPYPTIFLPVMVRNQ